jgi:hypothetical protein
LRLEALKYKLTTILEIKKLKMQYMDKANGKQSKLFEINMACWLGPFPSLRK